MARSVYAVGRPTLTAEGHLMAAVLTCGPHAALSHRAAAQHLGLLRGGGNTVDVTVAAPAVRSRRSVRVHSSRTLTAADVTVVGGIRCTTVARTLVDLADIGPKREVERALRQSEVLRLLDVTAVERALARAGPRRGTGLLRRVLADLEAPGLTQSELEERMLELCRSHLLPTPELAAWIALDDGVAYQADFLWRKERLIVETDGYSFHGSRRAFEHDRLRDQRLKLARYEVVRFTWRQVVHDADRVLATVEKLLARLARP